MEGLGGFPVETSFAAGSAIASRHSSEGPARRDGPVRSDQQAPGAEVREPDLEVGCQVGRGPGTPVRLGHEAGQLAADVCGGPAGRCCAPDVGTLLPNRGLAELIGGRSTPFDNTSLERIRRSGRPIALTVNGTAAAVVHDAAELGVLALLVGIATR
jgi:hypothetical protein